VKEPLIVLADEPTANLDSKDRRDILKLMLEMNRKHNTDIHLFHPRPDGYGLRPQARPAP
jgi:ABC-type lipoprotein export system ATPase subunit